MLNNSNDACSKVNDKEIQKNIEKNNEAFKSKGEASDFIPLDKDVPSMKVPLRQQRDRGQQKSYYHKTTSYYNSNRYQNRGMLNGNGATATYKSGSNTTKGHHLKNTHTNYIGSAANSSYQNVNGVSNYNRTKRKRDSSAISAHERSGKNENIANRRLDASADSTISCKTLNVSAIKEDKSKDFLQIEASGYINESQADFSKERCHNDQAINEHSIIKHVQRNITKTNSIEAFAKNSVANWLTGLLTLLRIPPENYQGE